MLLRRIATVTISAPDMAIASLVSVMSLYLPVPTSKRDPKVRLPMVNVSSSCKFDIYFPVISVVRFLMIKVNNLILHHFVLRVVSENFIVNLKTVSYYIEVRLSVVRMGYLLPHLLNRLSFLVAVN